MKRFCALSPGCGENAATELAEQHVVGRLVLGVVLEARALEVLHGVGLAVLQLLLELLAEGIAEPRQAATQVESAGWRRASRRLPVLPAPSAKIVTCLAEVEDACLGRYGGS